MNKITIIGRQNVGKSALFNCILKEKISISTDFSGYTRDKIYKNIKINSNLYTLIDTPGIFFRNKKIDIISLKQTWQAIKEANIILMILDAKDGLTNLDTSIIKNIKKNKKNIIYIINKIDKINNYDLINIKNEFKLKSSILVSAKLSKGIKEIKKNIILLTKTNVNTEEKNSLKTIVIGKPNVGKSSLINKIVKKKRITIYNKEGTTRDLIYVNTDIKKKLYTLIDTPGFTNKHKLKNSNFSIKKIIQETKKNNIVLYISDIENKITKQDLNTIKSIINQGKAIIFIINKSDKYKKKNIIDIENNIKNKLSFSKFMSVNFISAKYNFGIKNILNKISILDKFQEEEYSLSYFKKITKNLNNILKNKHIKIYYCRIKNYSPLIINIYYNNKKKIKKNYKKYIINYFFKSLNIINIPIKINLKSIYF